MCNSRRAVCAGGLAVLAAGALVRAGPTLSGIGFFPGQNNSQVFGVSRDGLTVVGTADYVPPGQAQPHTSAMRWRAATGMESLGTLAGPAWPGSVSSYGQAISGDGDVVVGLSDIAFRWTSAAGIAPFPTSGGMAPFQAMAVSDDGQSATGWFNSELQGPGFRWTAAGGTETIPQLGPTGFNCGGRAIANDGTVFGFGNDGFHRQAFKRGLDNVNVYLSPPPSYLYWEPRGVTPDGQVAVGRAYSSFTGFFSPCRYTAAGNVSLGRIGTDNHAEALAVSGDGATVVGWGQFQATNSGPQHALIWTEGLGLRDLKTLLQELGVNVTGWNLSMATGVSGDGRVVVGIGQHNGSIEGFIVRFPVCAADLGSQGGGVGRDHRLDNNDFIAFIELFFGEDARADVGVLGGVPGQDGLFNNNDFVVFIDLFFGGC